MKAFGYLLAGAALLPDFVLGSLSPAPHANLPNGWRYKGCYADKPFDHQAADHPNLAARGAAAIYRRALGGYFYQTRLNGGSHCISQCTAMGYKYAATNDNQCWCDNAIASNGTSTTAPAYGVPDPDNTLCQTPCRGNKREACGNYPSGSNNTHRLSLYEYFIKNLYFRFLFYYRNTTRNYDTVGEERCMEYHGVEANGEGARGGNVPAALDGLWERIVLSSQLTPRKDEVAKWDSTVKPSEIQMNVNLSKNWQIWAGVRH
ncbi:uncharacterized protein K460DRAFT_396046 [Cucurbitaria berberidis CBS 394.84]|uniref:WSC domain-containing protein n=1 Tax=Cucurbitaria berberidis CBS 394.84 TaxID=1168544 RepID=A0A9P4GJS1_9PLEO|nr:uncharacterized protein K460DRAFT_396046 [Cucurbitaria berberidis CBS 394.84]KAF1846719.1 hypothetical protein K460DRAFT_396046 [Cucurbitaria berberidis CBS 394.84]